MNTNSLDRWFYMVADDDGTETILPETTIPDTDQGFADAKEAIANATWRVAKLYLVNLAALQIKDVTSLVAVQIWNECKAAGETVEESIYRDFILDHVPAEYDVGYRGPINNYDDVPMRVAAE